MQAKKRTWQPRLEQLEDRLAPAITPLGNPFLVSPARHTVLDQAAVAVRPSHEFDITWAVRDDKNGPSGIFWQHFDRSGTAAGSVTHVSTPTTDTFEEAFPVIAVTDDGICMVAWTELRLAGSMNDVMGRVYGSNGTPLTDPFVISSATADDQSNVALATDGSSTFVVVWSGTSKNGDTDIYGRLFDAAGHPAGNDFLVNTTTPSNQTEPVVAMDHQGSFVATWESTGNVFAQRFDPSGNKQGAEFQVNTVTAGTETPSSIAMNDAGKFAVCYLSNTGGSHNTIYVQDFNADGTLAGSPFVNRTSLTPGRPAIGFGPHDSLVVTFSDQFGTASAGIDSFIAEYDALGRPVDSPLPVTSFQTGQQTFPTVAIAPDGQCVDCWVGAGGDAPAGVYARRFTMTATGSTPPVHNLTVIVHGLELFSSDEPAWVVDMATAIAHREGKSYDRTVAAKAVVRYDSTSLDPPPDSDPEFLLFNWTAISDLTHPGTADDDAVAGALVRLIEARLPGDGTRLNLHLIGHSRGAIVALAVTKLLDTEQDWSRLGFFQLTTLDPQPYSSPLNHEDIPLVIPSVVDWADNYFQELDTLPITLDDFTLGGGRVEGATNQNLSDALRRWNGRPVSLYPDHDEVHDWYHWTIDLSTPTTNPYADVPIPQRSILYQDGAAGGKSGFYFSLIGGGIPRLPTGTSPPSSFTAVANGFIHGLEYAGLLVDAAYQRILKRLPDPDGRSYWAQHVLHGLASDQMWAFLLTSNEYVEAHHGLGQEWLEALYQDVLARDADDGGLQNWLRYMKGGGPAISIAQTFVASDERWQQRIKDLYGACLDRSALPAEIEGWLRAIHHGLSPLDLTAAFFTSPECYFAPSRGDGNHIEWTRTLYQLLLRRTPTPEEISGWMVHL